MFAAIGFLWTFVGLVGSSLVTGKVREATNPAAKGADEVIQQNQGRGTIWL